MQLFQISLKMIIIIVCVILEKLVLFFAFHLQWYSQQNFAFSNVVDIDVQSSIPVIAQNDM